MYTENIIADIKLHFTRGKDDIKILATGKPMEQETF